MVLETDRLWLRPLTSDDAGRVAELAGDREIAANTLSFPHPYDEKMATEWIAKRGPEAEAGKSLVFAMVEKQGDLVGTLGLEFSADHNRAELGYRVGRPAWGRGLATEAARALIRYAFEELGLNRVEAHHLSRNPASGKVLEKCGMRHEGRLRQAILKWGEYEDIELYGILATDPPDVA